MSGEYFPRRTMVYPATSGQRLRGYVFQRIVWFLLFRPFFHPAVLSHNEASAV